MTALPSNYGTGAMLMRDAGSSYPSWYGTGALLTDTSKLPSWYGTGQLLQVPQTDPLAGLGAAMPVFGGVMSIFGAINSAIGAYYQAENQKIQLKMQANNLKFQAGMSRINAQAAERTAQDIMRAGETQVGRYTMQAGQARAGAVASMAGRGYQIGKGSSREMLASMDLVKEIDMMTINANTMRQATAARTQAFNYATQATMSGLSAQNLMGMSGTINPALSVSTSLLGSFTDIGSVWSRNRRIDDLLNAVSTRRI